MRNSLIVAGLLLLSSLVYASDKSSNDWSMNISYNNFDGALGPIKYYDGTIRYPKKDTSFTGYSMSVQKKLNYAIPISIVSEIGKLSGTYNYQNIDHSADITVFLMGPRFHFLENKKISPYLGFDVGFGDVSVPTLDELYYDFYFFGVVGGTAIKITNDISLNLNVQYANNDGATYTRYQYGLDYNF